MNKNKWYCVILCGCVGVGALAFGEGNMKKETGNSVTNLASLNSDERVALLEQLSKDRLDLQTKLIAQLDPSNPKEVTFSIAYLLGVYRMEGSIPHLSTLITLEADVVKRSREGMWDRYPIVEALIRIGNPAVPEMLKSIETSQDKKVRELSAMVIRYVMGPEIAKVVLERAMVDKPDAVKANFRAAIESIEPKTGSGGETRSAKSGK